MKNVTDILRQAHDVLYDELDRNVREMTVTESDFIRDCLDKMDDWIQNAERKFKRADSVKSSRKSIKSGCHGKSDKRRREEKEDELESSRNAKTFSKFNRISSLFIKNDVLKPGKTGIELNINGWKIINKEGKPTGGEAAEFNSEKAAKASEIYRKLADRYGEENVRTFKQD